MAVIGTPILINPPTSGVVETPPSNEGTALPADPGLRKAIVRSPSTSKDRGCFFDCNEIFAEIRVLPTVRHGSTVEWSLHPNFRDPGPYEFQLQFSRTGLDAAGDWEAVGLSAFNAASMVDDERRVYGKTNWAHYRVCLTTPLATYFSPATSSLGALNFRDRRRWAEMLRAHTINLRQEEGAEGYLLKRRLFGTPCDSDCRSELTGEVTNPQCTECLGTGFVGGYFDPLSCVYAALDIRTSHNDLDGGKARGTVNDHLRVKARILAVPQLFENDVWVEGKTDRRWYIHAIQNKAEYRGVAIVHNVEMRLAPFTDPIYQVEIEGQVPA